VAEKSDVVIDKTFGVVVELNCIVPPVNILSEMGFVPLVKSIYGTLLDVLEIELLGTIKIFLAIQVGLF
jgi:hypothetical protein